VTVGTSKETLRNALADARSNQEATAASLVEALRIIAEQNVEIERLRRLGPSRAPAGEDSSGPAAWLVLILRDGGQAETTIATFQVEADAREFFGPASAQWSDSYLCKVVRGPPDGHATANLAELRDGVANRTDDHGRGADDDGRS
jgi:hypothetical protein